MSPYPFMVYIDMSWTLTVSDIIMKKFIGNAVRQMCILALCCNPLWKAHTNPILFQQINF